MIKKTTLFLILLLALLPRYGIAETKLWNLPLELSATDTKVTFEVDTTWHTVHGIIKQPTGKAWLENPEDFRSVKLRVLFPLSSYDTDSESRDSTMRESMDSDKFPESSFVLNDVGNICDPKTMQTGVPCTFEASGNLTIRDITKVVRISSSATRNADLSYSISGETSILWTDFGVKDPSIFIAKVQPLVKIDFKLNLPATQATSPEVKNKESNDLSSQH